MKHIFSVIIVLTLLSVTITHAITSSKNTTLSIVLKDSTENIYDANDISSINMSEYSQDGTKHDILVSHVIYFKDHTEKWYQLDQIDKVLIGESSKRETKDGVIQLSEFLCEYLIAADQTTMTFAPGAIYYHLPDEGDLFFYEPCSAVIPEAICGKITKREYASDDSGNIILTYETLSPADIFDTYIVACNCSSGPTEFDLDVDGLDCEVTEDDDSADKIIAKAPVWDGQSSYKMKADSKLIVKRFYYDVLSGDFRANISILIYGDFMMNYQNSKKKNLTFATQAKYEMPLMRENDFARMMNPKMTFSASFKVKANDSKMKSNMKRKYLATFNVMVAEGDTIITEPKITVIDNKTTNYDGQVYLDGSLSLNGSFTLDIKPAFRKMGLRLTTVTGPTLKGSTGIAQLDSMSHEMCDSLYAKSKINEVTTAVVSASILDYHYSEPKTYKMDKFGKMTATNVDGSTRLIPEFKKYNFSASSNSVTADIKTFSKLTSPVMAGVEVLQSQSDSRGLFKKLNVCTLDPNNALTDLTVDFEHNTNFNEVTYDRYYYRPIVEYAGYQVICPALKPEPNICYNSDNHPHAIDLNLPSGTLWCCTNVGAQAPDDYGYGYTLQQAKEFEDDAWRLPTITEIEELFRVCNIIQYGNSIIAVGPNGNYITIPLSGYLYGYDSRFDQGKCMYWWSSNTELSEGEMCGWHFRYTTSYGTLSDLDGSGKYCSVRLVSRKK